MDIYQKALTKLYRETGGSDAKAVDLLDLVKQLGFHANYKDIFRELSGRGWIAETSKPDWVKITHWGVKEAKQAASDAPDARQAAKRESVRLLAEAREIVRLLEELSADAARENLEKIEKKAGEIKAAAGRLKSNL